MSITVFVTDGAERPALAIVRALGSRGATVIVGAEERVSLAATSRYCSRRVTYPSPDRDRAGFEHFLLNFVAREHVDVVLPVTDVTTHAVCTHQDRIGHFAAVAVPPLDVFEGVSDKGALLERAARLGVPTPRTLFIDRGSRLGDVINEVDYPAVVKPTRSRIPVDGGWVRASVHYAYSAAELLNLYQTVPYLSSSPSLIQQRIVGPGIGIFMLFDRGRLVCEFGHRRLREKPPAGGVSVLRESTRVEAEVREYATRLLGDQGWNGVAMMEFKQDSRTGRLVPHGSERSILGIIATRHRCRSRFPLPGDATRAGPVSAKGASLSNWLEEPLVARRFRSFVSSFVQGRPRAPFAAFRAFAPPDPSRVPENSTAQHAVRD